MIVNYFSDLWRSVAPTVGDHLWQSTLFAAAAALLTFVLRKNHARTRYWLWLAASGKFLFPFFLLAAIGSRLAWSQAPAVTNTGLYLVITNAGQPFTQPATPIHSQADRLTFSASLIHFLPVFLTTLWLCGFLIVLCRWCVRWRRMSAFARQAVPLRAGRELDSLRRVERTQGIQKPIEIRLSSTSLEPGIFGIIRPVLVWPQGISGRLDDSHLEAILAHELCHVLRRDNLAATLHMLVEAIFWFHPLVWWLGSRLLEERERACDEAVLETMSDRKIYAESILKICEFCVGSLLTCVPGVTGADLKKRILHIMAEDTSRKLDFTRKLLLCAAGLLAVAVPTVFGLLRATQIHAQSQSQNTAANALAYDTVSIKPTAPTETMTRFQSGPGTFTATNMTLQGLIGGAYGVETYQISGGPAWLSSEKFDIQASMSQSTQDKFKALPEAQRNLERKLMLQSLLAEHFHLQFRHQNQELPVYSLVIAESGPKLKEARPDDTYASGLRGFDGQPTGPHTMRVEIGEFTVQALPMTAVAQLLTKQLDHTVLDNTGLTREYDFTLKWTPDNTQPAALRSPENNQQGPSIFTAIQEQLGLKLEPKNAPMEVLVVNHAEEPAQTDAKSQTQNVASSSPAYELASIKLDAAGTASLKTGNGVVSQRVQVTPGTFTAQNISMWELIRLAYSVPDYQVSGAPDWFSSELFDVDAKAQQSAIDAMRKLSDDQRDLQNRAMLQSLLQNRFKLSVRHVTENLPIYSLVVLEPGKLREAQGDCGPAPQLMALGQATPPPCGSLRVLPWVGRIDGLNVPISPLVANLSGFTKRMVLDNTNLKGKYDISLTWFPSQGEFPPRPAYLPATYQPDPKSHPLLTAIQQQLGLKLESQTGPVPLLIIDHVERPSEN